MSKNGQGLKYRIVIELDAQSGEIRFDMPDNWTVALGMLETAREALMMRRARPALAPQNPIVMRPTVELVKPD